MSDTVEFEVDDLVRYRIVKGRGRPGVGRVVKKMGIFTEIENSRSKKIDKVHTSMITALYEFRPYNTVGRQLESQNV